MAPQLLRIRHARRIARHPRMRVTGMETEWGTRFTADSLVQARRRFPNCRFIWIMGADNLQQICHWDRWQRIFRMVAVAVFDRSPYSQAALAGLAARRFRRARLTSAGRLAITPPPAWIFMHIKRHPASATAIRRQSGGSAAW
jgi:nicotinate-nucleotide adenylyltransferase